MEFRTAQLKSLEDRRARVIVIMLEDIRNVDDLDDELKVYVKTNTYIKWGDPLFWSRLRYAMPHSRRGSRNPKVVARSETRALESIISTNV